MHITLVTSEFPSHTFIFRKALILAQMGHQVHVLARSKGNWKNFETIPENLTVEYLIRDQDFSSPLSILKWLTSISGKTIKDFSKAFKLWQLVSANASSLRNKLTLYTRYLPFLDYQTDILHFEFLTLGATYVLLPQVRPDILYFSSCRGSDIYLADQQHESSRRQLVDVLQSATGLHCVVENMRDKIFQMSGRSDRIWVNRPAINPDQIKQIKTDYSLGNPVRLIIVGRLDWKKGLDYLFAAVEKLHKNGINVQLDVIGKGDLYSRLRFAIFDMGLSEHINLHGYMKPHDVMNHLVTADMFVLSSHTEGLSNAVLEAMAVGVPVITTNAGGMAEAVRDGQDGIVVPVRDSHAIYEAIKRLIADETLRKEMAISARARIISDFTLERQGRVFEEMYQAVLQGEQ